MKRKKAPKPDLEEIIPLLIGIWRRASKESGPSDRLQTREFRRTVEAIKILQQGFDKGQSLNNLDYFAQNDLLLSYLLYHWVVHYQEGLSILGELPFAPKRVLDVCSGPAAYAFAALRHGCKEVYATDRNQKALELGAEVCGRFGMPLTIRPWNCLKGNLPIEGKFDLIIAAHCLTELFPENGKNWAEAQHRFIQSLFDRLTPNGFLLVVDNSFLEANRRLLTLRDKLVEEGISVQAPCLWRGECPALKGTNTPCYAQREMEKPYLIREFQRAAQINLSSLKMTYVIFRAKGQEWPVPVEKPYYRVISPPVETFQGKRYYLCGTDGKFNLGSHLNPLTKETKAFDYLKRGELISIENPLRKQNSLDLVRETRIHVEAACGKPVPEELDIREDMEDEY